jgi:hypothetical protein
MGWQDRVYSFAVLRVIASSSEHHQFSARFMGKSFS